MRRIWILPLLLTLGRSLAQDGNPAADPTPTIPPAPAKWSSAAVPWGPWFKNNTMVTDKSEYVHFFWNAQDFKSSFEVKDKKYRLEEAALQLVSKLYPADSKADPVKVDIVYVLERDSYGQPKWDSLQQVAHFEFLRSKAPKAAKGKKEPSAAALQKVFDKEEIF